MTGAAPCASKGEIGALFSDFLGRNAPEMGSLHEQVCKKRKTSGNESTDSEGADGADVSKKARRRKQNRVAAQTSREKKKKYLTNLENQVNCLNQQNMDLQAQLLALQEENRRLKEGSSPSDMPSLITSIVKAEPQSESYSMPALKVKAETEYSMPTLTTLQNDPEYPMAMVARDIAHLASSMQTTPITFESAVFYFPQQLEVMTGFVLMLNLVFQMSQALLACPKNLFHSFSPEVTPLMTSPATTGSLTCPSDLSQCLSYVEKLKIELKVLDSELSRPADGCRRRPGYPQRVSRLLAEYRPIAAAA